MAVRMIFAATVEGEMDCTAHDLVCNCVIFLLVFMKGWGVYEQVDHSLISRPSLLSFPSAVPTGSWMGAWEQIHKYAKVTTCATQSLTCSIRLAVYASDKYSVIE